MRAGLSAAQLLFSGFIALAVAMGIGRFAFTPLLPMMQQDAGLTLAEGGWLASANYLGYLVGALISGRAAWSGQALLRGGLGFVVLTTALMGMTDGWLSWLIWRFLAGVGSAWVLVSAASLCLARLALMGLSARAGLIFAGVGVGIAAAGLLCLGLDIIQVSSPASWLILGGVACLGALAAWPLWQSNPAAAPATTAVTPDASSTSRVPAPEKSTRHWRLVASYGLFGFGYILPATFLPAQARLLVADPALFGLAWPLFGLAAALSTVLTGRFLAAYSRRHVWAASQLFMAVGVLLPALVPTLLSIAIAAIFVGGTFMVITMLAMQEAQAIAPREVHRLMAAMTAAFAAGQLAGPLFFSFTHVYFGAPLGFALVLAASGLVAACYLVLRAE
jgi:MFS family permease